MRCSLTVRVPMKRSSCCTYAESAVSVSAVAGSPLMALIPVTCSCFADLKVSVLSKVVLPAPLEPIRASSSPGYAAPFTGNKTPYHHPAAFHTRRLNILRLSFIVCEFGRGLDFTKLVLGRVEGVVFITTYDGPLSFITSLDLH
jgi:hypothetical protein